MYTILLVAHTILVLFLIVMILLQRADGDGLGGLGGGGGNQFMTGRSAANFMTKTTSFLAAAFMITSLTLAAMASHMTSKSVIDSVTTGETESVEKTETKTEEKSSGKEAQAPSAPKPE